METLILLKAANLWLFSKRKLKMNQKLNQILSMESIKLFKRRKKKKRTKTMIIKTTKGKMSNSKRMMQEKVQQNQEKVYRNLNQNKSPLKASINQ